MMKEFLTISLTICSLFLSACNTNSSIGIIGGSDGPTAIFVGEENGNTDILKKPIRMIKVECLDDEMKIAFEAKIVEKAKKLYSRLDNGDIIFGFNRLFFVAHK